MTQSAIYPGTFDPLTNGHVDVIHRAARIFNKVIVAVASSAGKQPHFSVDARVSMCEAVFSTSENVQVERFDGLLVDFAKSKKINIILRGLRTASDFDFEVQLAGMNRRMAAEMETLFIPASETNALISSSMIREIAAMGGDVSLFVPPAVAEQLCP